MRTTRLDRYMTTLDEKHGVWPPALRRHSTVCLSVFGGLAGQKDKKRRYSDAGCSSTLLLVLIQLHRTFRSEIETERHHWVAKYHERKTKKVKRYHRFFCVLQRDWQENYSVSRTMPDMNRPTRKKVIRISLHQNLGLKLKLAVDFKRKQSNETPNITLK
ncbi:hypothetical protein YC2023_093731 [Brassica napus]